MRRLGDLSVPLALLCGELLVCIRGEEGEVRGGMAKCATGRAGTHARGHAHAHAPVHVHAHARACMRMRACVLACACARVCACVCVCVRMCTHALTLRGTLRVHAVRPQHGLGAA